MDLNAPLGMKPPRDTRRSFAGRNWGLVAGGAVATTIVAAVAVGLVTADPRGGDPYAVAPIPPSGRAAWTGGAPGHDGLAPPDAAPNAYARQDGRAVAGGALDPMRTGSIPRSDAGMSVAAKATDTVENGVKVFRSGGTSPILDPGAERGPLIIDVSKVLDDPLGHSNAHASTATPAATDMPASPARRPRVAIFVSGMGLSEEATKTALDMMPPAVTLAFVPYGASIATTVASARAKGHEVLVQIPMRNTTGATPGPHALRPGESAAALHEDLAWLTSRFTGYDGVVNLLGAPVTADEAVMTGLMRDIGGRGLFYLDDGLSKRETGLAAAAGLNVPARRADIVLDATADPRVIEANLQTLASIARRNGSAIGMASGLPDHMAMIARFAGGLEADGISLVPVADLVAGDATKNRGVAEIK